VRSKNAGGTIRPTSGSYMSPRTSRPASAGPQQKTFAGFAFMKNDRYVRRRFSSAG
jgi:hypothetical protein